MPHLTTLPQTCLVTPEPLTDRPLVDFIAHLERAVEAGIRLVQLRGRTVTALQYAWLAEQALRCCRRHDPRLLLNAPVDEACALEADGIQLTSTRLMACVNRPWSSGLLVSTA